MLICTSKITVSRFVSVTMCTSLSTNVQGPLSITCSKVKGIQYSSPTYPPTPPEAGGCQPELMESGFITDSKNYICMKSQRENNTELEIQ